jgi:hypothetical protein
VHDFVLWRDELRSVRDLGAFRTITRNLVPAEGPPVPIQVAEMTAAGFTMARVPRCSVGTSSRMTRAPARRR